MHWTEAEELAAAALGLAEDAGSEAIERALCDRWSTDLDTFQKIAEALIVLTPVARTAITGTACHGFVKGGAFIVKQDA